MSIVRDFAFSTRKITTKILLEDPISNLNHPIFAHPVLFSLHTRPSSGRRGLVTECAACITRAAVTRRSRGRTNHANARSDACALDAGIHAKSETGCNPNFNHCTSVFAILCNTHCRRSVSIICVSSIFVSPTHQNQAKYVVESVTRDMHEFSSKHVIRIASQYPHTRVSECMILVQFHCPSLTAILLRRHSPSPHAGRTAVHCRRVRVRAPRRPCGAAVGDGIRGHCLWPRFRSFDNTQQCQWYWCIWWSERR